jgi:multidrug resistance efflux pump
MTGCSSKNQESATIEVDLTQEIKEIEAFGIVKAEESKYVTIDLPAEVLDVLVEEGQRVKLNDTILILDTSQYELQIQEKKSELNIARLEQKRITKNLEEFSSGLNDTEIKKLQNDLDYAKKLFEQSVEDYNSNELLYSEGVISKDAFDKFKIIMEEAKNKTELIEYELQQAIKQNKKEIESESDMLEIKAEHILQLENVIADLESKLNKPYIMGRQIVSEFENAAVFNIAYASGDKTDASKKSFGIVNLNKLVVEADIVEEFIKDVQIGATVRIVPIADRAREYEGKVMYISQIAFNKNGETVVPIKISIDNADSFIMPNYNVDVFIDVK